MRNRFLAPRFFLPCALALTGCGSGGGNFPNTPLLTSAPVGSYGAKDIQFQVTTVDTRIELPCGQGGQITQPLTLDASGHFDVTGNIYPYLAPGQHDPLPILTRFTGTTDGKTMKLTITPAPVLAPTRTPSTGVYTLTYGDPGDISSGSCP